MKKQTLLLIAAAAIVLVVAILFLRREPVPAPAPVGPVPSPGETPAAPAPTPPSVVGPVTPQGEEATPREVLPRTPSGQSWPTTAPAPAPAAAEPVDVIKLVQVQPGEVLATVNGVQITLDDMLDPSTAPSSLAEDTFNHLLNSAIERELIEQSARTRGIGLTADQIKQLEEMRASMENPSPESGQPAMSPQQIDYQLRMAAAGLLRGNLAASAGVPSPYPTPQQVEQYYAAHRAEFGELPADPAQREIAWQKIDAAIRDRFGVQYQEAMQRFLDQLGSQANISITEAKP